jgi:RHS repeat-associated protein
MYARLLRCGVKSAIEDANAYVYQYDDIYQLISETRTGTNPYTISYDYDQVGNRLHKVKDSVTTTYTYNNNNQLSTESSGGPTITYSYDNNGNLVSKTGGGNRSYTWDWRNRLVSVSAPGNNTAYEYDGDGTRLSKTEGGVKTKYINDAALPLVQVLCETDNSGNIQATYNYGNDLIAMNRTSTISYYLYDGLGSVKQLTDSSQAVVASYTYDSFGNLIASSGSITNAYGFTGEQQFGEADELVFLRARYYKPSIGRFLQADPLVVSPALVMSPDGKKINLFNPLIRYKDGLNLYTYVKNNPINFVDPWGLQPADHEEICRIQYEICKLVCHAHLICDLNPVKWIYCMFKCHSKLWDCTGEGYSVSK